MRLMVQTALLAGLAAVAAPSFSHIVLDVPAALAGTSYRATLRVGHGCDRSPTTAIQVIIPAGFQGAQPMPKAGWRLDVRSARLDKPYDDHGKAVTEDVAEITWTATSKESALPDAFYDEFVLRGKLPAQAGPMWFKVVQTCEKGSTRWVDVPASGTSITGIKAPAALLEIIESSQVGHVH